MVATHGVLGSYDTHSPLVPRELERAGEIIFRMAQLPRSLDSK